MKESQFENLYMGVLTLLMTGVLLSTLVTGAHVLFRAPAASALAQSGPVKLHVAEVAKAPVAAQIRPVDSRL